jgi:mevalonate kinase
MGAGTPPDWIIRVTSSIPVASGLGSGAATATAIVRALALAAHRPLDPAQVSTLVYESEKIFHGTPSGVDNTVIAFQQPVWFVRDRPPTPFSIGQPFTVVIADTGIPSPTSITVGDVRRHWQADPGHFEELFDAIARVAVAARHAIETGNTHALGPLMDENQRLLQEMGVSSPELERLCAAAHAAGAPGAKLSGGGRGGNMIALADQDSAAEIASALLAAGASRTIITTVAALNHDLAVA